MTVPQDADSDPSEAPPAQGFFQDVTWTVFVTGWLCLPAGGLLLFSFAMLVAPEHSLLPLLPVTALAGSLAFLVGRCGTRLCNLDASAWPQVRNAATAALWGAPGGGLYLAGAAFFFLDERAALLRIGPCFALASTFQGYLLLRCAEGLKPKRARERLEPTFRYPITEAPYRVPARDPVRSAQWSRGELRLFAVAGGLGSAVGWLSFPAVVACVGCTLVGFQGSPLLGLVPILALAVVLALRTGTCGLWLRERGAGARPGILGTARFALAGMLLVAVLVAAYCCFFPRATVIATVITGVFGVPVLVEALLLLCSANRIAHAQRAD